MWSIVKKKVEETTGLARDGGARQQERLGIFCPREKKLWIGDKYHLCANMPQTRRRSKKASTNLKPTARPQRFTDHEPDNSGSENESDAGTEKDSDDEYLERLVLGDQATFQSQLGPAVAVDADENADEDTESSEDEENADDGAEENLEGVDDGDVCGIQKKSMREKYRLIDFLSFSS